MDLMKILGPIEKFINEHGSASIQTKHIALLKEQFSFLTQENAVLKTTNHELQSHVNDLEKEIIDLRVVIENLQKLNESLKQQLSEKHHKDLLDEQTLADRLNAELAEE